MIEKAAVYKIMKDAIDLNSDLLHNKKTDKILNDFVWFVSKKIDEHPDMIGGTTDPIYTKNERGGDTIS